jgi:hypothetical protein
MRKYTYVRIYFDPTGKTGLPNIYSTDPVILDWVFNQVRKYLPDCIVGWDSHDLTGARCEIQLDQIEDKDQALMSWIVRLLCESGFEPYAHAESYMHFRRFPE